MDEFYSILKINDHTGSIKLETRPCRPCSEERIESERHVNRTNELLHMADKKKKNTWVLEKWKKKGEKKKQKLSSVERLLERWIEWTFDGIFERFYRWVLLAFLCAYTRCSIVFANIYFRRDFLQTIRTRLRALCFCADESNEDSSRETKE